MPQDRPWRCSEYFAYQRYAIMTLPTFCKTLLPAFVFTFIIHTTFAQQSFHHVKYNLNTSWKAFADDAKEASPPVYFNIKDYGAKGDGKTVDTKAINDAIEAAVKGGGGTVFFPAGTFLSYSIRLKSNISLYLDQGCVLLAADSLAGGRYDDPEPNEWGDKRYQDFGHIHWNKSLIWL